ncbi:MAG: hypothetical protein J0M34_05760 [Alphaproteobacteria bacterium]|nr:hypothetical protein [Alphaproteobacteria bacterium]
MRYSIYIILPFMISGCVFNQTSIQRDYERERKFCQAYAEGRIEKFASPDRNVSQKGRNAELVTLFSDCMAKEGWQVATPKRAGKTSSSKPATAPAQPVPQQPAPQQPAPQQPVQTQATPLTPSPSMPPLRQPVNPNAATYQPAAPANAAPVPYYGNGAGRSF